MLRDPNALEQSPMPIRGRAVTVATLVLAGLMVAGLRGPAPSDRAMAQEPATRKTPAPGDAQPLPPLDPSSASSDVHLAIEIRPAALLKNPEFKKLAGQIPADGSKATAAFLSGDIEQVIVLGFDRQPGGNPPNSSIPPQLVFILRAAKPMDWKGFMPPKMEEVKADGFTYFRAGTVPGSTCARVLDDRTLLMGSEGDAKVPPLGGDRPKGRHPWDDAWKKVPPAAIRAALDTPWLVRQVRPGGPGPASPVMGVISPLLDKAQAYAVALDVADVLALDGLATCGTEEGAGRVADTLRAALTLGRNFLPDLRREAEKGPPDMARPVVDLVDALDSMLETAKVEQDKSVARLHAKADAAIVATTARMLLPAIGAARGAARRSQCINNLKQIALAMHNYASAHDGFPPAVLYGPDGKTPYSWRVALLPYLEANDVYSQYKFDEPWDGPNNSKLLPRMPIFFACADDDRAIPSHSTSYFVPTGPATLFPDRKEAMKFSEITDGISNTIMVVEARREVPWTKPEDIPFPADLLDGTNRAKPLPTLGGLHPGGFDAAFADGAVRFVKDTINPVVLRALLTRAGGEVISADAY